MISAGRCPLAQMNWSRTHFNFALAGEKVGRRAGFAPEIQQPHPVLWDAC